MHGSFILSSPDQLLTLTCLVPDRAVSAGVRPRLDPAVSPGQCRPLPQPESAGPQPEPGHHLVPQSPALLHLPGRSDHPRGLQAGRRRGQEEGEPGAGRPHQVQEQEVHESRPAVRAAWKCGAETGPEAAGNIVNEIFDPDVIVTAHRLCCVLFDIDILCIVIIVELGRNNVLLHSCLVFSHEGLGREESYLSLPNQYECSLSRKYFDDFC